MVRRFRTKAKQSTGYPQAMWLFFQVRANGSLTRTWHGTCNKQRIPTKRKGSEMSQQRLPSTKDAEKPTTKKQRQIVDLILSSGKSIQKVADDLGRDVANVYRDLRKPHVKRYLQERTLEHLGVLAPIAARTQQELLSSDSDHVRASVSENILDRHLGKPITRSQVAVGGQINVVIDLS